MLPIVFTAYFFPAREAWPYFALALVVPRPAVRLRRRRRSHASLFGELLILLPCYWLLTFLLISGKRGMIQAARREPTRSPAATH